MYFRLRDIEYDISSCSISLNYEDTGIRMYIEVNAELHLLNFDEVNEVRKKVDETKQWNDFNAELKFKVTYDGKDYFGKVVYKNGKINHTTYFDENCPLDVIHQTMGWSDVLNYVDFYFLVTEKG